MENVELQNRKTAVQQFLDNLSNKDDKVEIIRRKSEKNFDSDCHLHKTNPPKVPEKFFVLSADVPDLLEVNTDEHYQEKEYDQQIDPEIENDTKMFEERWTGDELRNFEYFCRKLNGRCKNKKKIELLKEKLPNKTAKEIVQHYYISYKPNAKSKQIKL